MKKVLALALMLLLTFPMLAGCGSSSNDSGTESSSINTNESDTESADSSNAGASLDRVIKASELVSKEDAEVLLGQSVEEQEGTTLKPLINQARYSSEDKALSVDLWQKALYDKDNSKIPYQASNWPAYVEEMEKSFIGYTDNPENSDFLYYAMEGKHGTYYLNQPKSFGMTTLQIFCGEYMITLFLSNRSMTHEDSEEEKTWKKDTIMEIGDFAVDSLKEIIE